MCMMCGDGRWWEDASIPLFSQYSQIKIYSFSWCKVSWSTMLCGCSRVVCHVTALTCMFLCYPLHLLSSATLRTTVRR